MINIGIAGKPDAVEEVIALLKNFPDMMIRAKSSAGFIHRQESLNYQVPEVNRNELAEICDVIVFAKGAESSSEMTGEIIRKTRHIFFYGHPDFTPEECNELEKLRIESKSVVHLHNPLFYHPIIRWVEKHFPLPAYFELVFTPDLPDTDESLIPLLLLPINLLDGSLQKIRIHYYPSPSHEPGFMNIRLESGDSSVFCFNLHYNNPRKEFMLKGFSGSRFFTADFTSRSLVSGHKPVVIKENNQIIELQDFFNAIKEKNGVKTGLTEYASALRILSEIVRKKKMPGQ